MLKTIAETMRPLRSAVLVAAVLLAACGKEAPPPGAGAPAAAPAAAPVAEPTAASPAEPLAEPSGAAPAPATDSTATTDTTASTLAEGAGVTIAFLGDSLTAGFGLDEDQAFPALIAAALSAEGRQVRVVNAGISGDTTAGGLARLDWLLRNRPDILVVSLGANDGLRGLPLASSEQNLRAIVEKGKAAGARILLVGMMIPPNYGPEYTSQFAEIYPRIAAEQQVPLVPFLLEGVAGVRQLNQADGIHPTAEGQKILAQTLLGPVRSLLDDVETSQRPYAPASPLR